ncbi:head decoration protein [Salinicola sp. CPA57]|uniref:head decoration protein n=1 Tax=Salinicola sp. CPA57 TaxID=1949080 RepID=UPI000DA19E67|nr:head decoration protein [Salinicola sp. CPA57]
MTTFTEGRHTGEHVVSEANGARSRETGFLAAGHNLPAGTVVAKLDDEFVPFDPTATDGAEPPEPTAAATAYGVLYGATDSRDGAAKCVVHSRDCEVHGEALTWPDAITDAQEATALEAMEARGVIVRD